MTSRHTRRALLGVLIALAAVTTICASDVRPAAAEPPPIVLSGHGWGHGRGLGQFGAQGYATMFGWSSAAILNHFFHPTGAAAVAPGLSISVRLVAMDGLDLWVTSASPFSVAGYSQPAGAAVFLTTNGAGQYLIAGTKGSLGCGGELHPAVTLTAPPVATSLAGDPGSDLSKMLTVCGGPTYRGQLQFVRGDGAQRTVNIVGLEEYLRGVVPRESPSWFAPAALEAQAVAARSYALGEGGESGQRYTYAKTCDTISCQVYGGAGMDGVSRETASTDGAVSSTANLVRRYSDGSLARTEFSSSTGGWTVPGNFTAMPDDGDAVASNPRHNWQTSLTPAVVAQRYGVGSYVGIQVTKRNGFGDWGGRIQELSVIGTTKSVKVSGAQFRSDWGLFSDWWTTDTTSGPSAVSPSPGRTDVIARGADGGAWQRTQTGAGFGAWKSLGGILTSDPDVSSWGGGRLDLFTRGTDGGLWHKWSNDGTNWSDWEGLGGVLASGPSAVSWGPNRIDIFVVGGDGALWSKVWNGAWSNWFTLGGLVVGDPDVSSWGPNRLDVFVRGIDNALYHKWFTGAWFTGWEHLGGALTSGTAAVSWGVNRVDVVARGADGAAWTRVWNGSIWVQWGPLGGALASDPDIAAPGVNRLNLVTRGVDGAIWQKSWTGTWGSWFSLGPPG